MRPSRPLAVVAALSVLWLSVAPAGAAMLGENLILNPGAELGPPAGNVNGNFTIPFWNQLVGNATVLSYGDPSGVGPTPFDPGPADRGMNLFGGGPVSGVEPTPFSVLGQEIDVSDLAGVIDTGAVDFDLEAFLGGFKDSPDKVSLFAFFLNATLATLGFAAVGPVTRDDRGNMTGLFFREQTGDLPAGTRFVSVSLEFDPHFAFADNLSLILSLPQAGVPWPGALALLGLGVAALGARGVLRRLRWNSRRPETPACRGRPRLRARP
jgi:hypothetical protein